MDTGDLDFLLSYGTMEQRSQAIVKVTRAKSTEAIPTLRRAAQHDPDPEIRALAAKAVKYIERHRESDARDDTHKAPDDAVQTSHHAPYTPPESASQTTPDKPEITVSPAEIRRQAIILPILGLVFLAVGTIGLISAAIREINNQNFAARATVATGVVVDFRVVEPDAETVWYLAIVEFADQSGEIYRIEDTEGGPLSPNFEVGDSVEVLYLPEAPSQGVLRYTTSIFTNPNALVFTGLANVVSVLIGVGLMIGWWRMGRATVTTSETQNGPMRERLTQARLEDILQHGTSAQRTEAITEAIRIRLTDAIPVLVRSLQRGLEPQERAFALKSLDKLIHIYRSSDNDDMDAERKHHIESAIVTYEGSNNRSIVFVGLMVIFNTVLFLPLVAVLAPPEQVPTLLLLGVLLIVAVMALWIITAYQRRRRKATFGKVLTYSSGQPSSKLPRKL